MRRLARLTGLLGLLFALSATADFQEGVTAFRQGDYDAARSAWQALAESGDARAQFNLALLYANGYGVNQNLATARRWLEAAADAGNAEAQYNLALMLQVGRGVEADVSAARGWYEKAARQGLAEAQNNLGLMYLHGDGMPRDGALAIRWLKRAAAGSAEARGNLSRLAESLPEARVTASSVNLRAGPSTDASVLTQVNETETARVLDRRGSWTRLWFVDRSEVGWIADDLLDVDAEALAALDAMDAEATPSQQTPSEPADGASQVPARDPDSPERLTVANAVANLRATPDTDADVVARLVNGTAVELIERRDGWRRVRVPSRELEGWVAAFLLNGEDDRPAESRGPGSDEGNSDEAPAYGAGGG